MSFPPRPVMNGDIVQLVHGITGRALNRYVLSTNHDIHVAVSFAQFGRKCLEFEHSAGCRSGLLVSYVLNVSVTLRKIPETLICHSIFKTILEDYNERTMRGETGIYLVSFVEIFSNILNFKFFPLTEIFSLLVNQ